MNAKQMKFEQMHIDVARNATDDFNPFHDKHKWQSIKQNPFGGPIVLGFQLESLIEYQIKLFRQAHKEYPVLEAHNLRFSNYQFTFASAVTCGQAITVDIKGSRLKTSDNTTLSNRVCLKSNDKLALAGYKRESQNPLFLPNANLNDLGDLRKISDRTLIPGTGIFLKRKFMTNSNAKNFLTSSLAEQADYFDELADYVRYPEIFPCSLISCALLEKGLHEGYDFELNPLIYTSHKISIDRCFLTQLSSNDVLHILVERAGVPSIDHLYHCYGSVGNSRLLFRAEVALRPLVEILGES